SRSTAMEMGIHEPLHAGSDAYPGISEENSRDENNIALCQSICVLRACINCRWTEGGERFQTAYGRKDLQWMEDGRREQGFVDHQGRCVCGEGKSQSPLLCWR